MMRASGCGLPAFSLVGNEEMPDNGTQWTCAGFSGRGGTYISVNCHMAIVTRLCEYAIMMIYEDLA